MNQKHYTVFGIRHHGPGSAINLVRALTDMQPDYVLIEGPPDADSAIRLAGQAEMKPPVALLVYDRQNPLHAAFYPFAEFSPEWQAIRFALQRDIPVQFMDLPQAHQLAVKSAAATGRADDAEMAVDPPDTDITEPLQEPGEAQDAIDGNRDQPDRGDPLDWFARQAGYEDGEAWWEHAVEERLESGDLFRAISDVMTGLREQYPSPYPEAERDREQRREAWMCKTLRAVLAKGCTNIAVVCGAWHAPALLNPTKAGADNAILKGLAKTKVESTWVPWTYGRLARRSGYGAGIAAPGWYHHLWLNRKGNDHRTVTTLTARWFIAIADLLRKADLDASSAHVIEAVRLAETLAAMRHRPFPGLEELNDAAQAVICFGERHLLSFIRERLLIGERMGSIPVDTPKVPLQVDLEKTQRTLRLKPSAATQSLDLDLRKESSLARSHLLHRLNLLNVPWGRQIERGAGNKGTFHEYWDIRWEPEFAVAVIEAAMWGTSVVSAAAAKAVHTAQGTESIRDLAELVNAVILADLPTAVEPVVGMLKARSARTNDVTALMQALPSLVTILRYGNVRQSDSSMVAEVVDGLIPRICIGLSPACRSLDDDAAGEMNEKITAVNHALSLIENEDYHSAWTEVLRIVITSDIIHARVKGKACRLLFDRNRVASDEVARLMSLAVSPGNDVAMAAAWIEGFLQGSGMLMVHDPKLWSVLDVWISELPQERFIHILPLLRRTFSTFPSPERQQIGRRVKAGRAASPPVSREQRRMADIKPEWGDAAARSAAQLLGLFSHRQMEER